MSLTAIYQAFLASPSAPQLSNDASLNYITTLTTINKPDVITKHLSKQGGIVKKKQEKVLSTIEGDNAICLDVETTLEFRTGGGAYLPGLDDNFLTDRVVTFPVIHIVHFNSNSQIQQIRLYWDQGSVLKLVDVIGSRAKNWPIRDGKDQARLIASSAAQVVGNTNAVASTTKQMGDVTITGNPPPPRKSFRAGDTHSSLSLFAPRDENRDESYTEKAVAPRASAKPAQRDYHDLFVGNDSASEDRAASSAKEKVVGSKIGAGKNFQPSRIFDNDGPETTTASPVKVHPTKYSHFEFADGSDEPKQDSKPARPKTKHQSQWDFSDFATPEKILQKSRPQDTRNFDFGEEEGNAKSPTKYTRVIQPRRDAETHFEMKDEGTPIERPLGHPRGQGVNDGLGLYKNHLYGDDSSASPPKAARPTSSVVNVKDRKKDFGPHWEISESSPGLGEKTASDNNRPIPEHRMKAVKMMNAQWEATDASPGAPAEAKPQESATPSKLPSMDKENMNMGFGKERATTGIKTGGDGMGGRKGAASTWGFGDETDEFGVEGAHADKFRAGKKQQAPKDSGIWDF
ncbi:hypothetical protein MMC30_006446 [Trapelia coarctata]|nr:hypothetical protein [Trapelia coarctata]